MVASHLTPLYYSKNMVNWLFLIIILANHLLLLTSLLLLLHILLQPSILPMQCQQETLLLHSLPHVVVTTKLDVGSSVELLVQPMDINFEDVCEESFSQVNL